MVAPGLSQLQEDLEHEIEVTAKESKLKKPRRVVLFESEDHSGDPAYYVYIVYPKSMKASDLTWKKLRPLYEKSKNLLWERSGRHRWPYVYARREDEMPVELRD